MANNQPFAVVGPVPTLRQVHKRLGSIKRRLSSWWCDICAAVCINKKKSLRLWRSVGANGQPPSVEVVSHRASPPGGTTAACSAPTSYYCLPKDLISIITHRTARRGSLSRDTYKSVHFIIHSKPARRRKPVLVGKRGFFICAATYTDSIQKKLSIISRGGVLLSVRFSLDFLGFILRKHNSCDGMKGLSGWSGAFIFLGF